jgi:hypothetical protein
MCFALQRKGREGIEEGLYGGLKRTASRKVLVLVFHPLVHGCLVIY